MSCSKNNLHPRAWFETMGSGYKQKLILIAMGLFLFIGLHGWVTPKIDFIGQTENYFSLQDFAYHIVVVKQFWFIESGNIYDPAFQLHALSTHMGRPTPAIMPIGVTPVALFVWMPFAYIASHNLPLAYSLWMSSSAAILMLAIWRMLFYLAPIKGHPPFLPVLLCGITGFSITSAAAVLTGQTSIWTTGLICLILFNIIRDAHNKTPRSPNWGIVLLTILAGLKPQYVIIALGMLLIYKKWKELFYAALISVLLAATLTPFLTPSWIHSYGKALYMYGSGGFPELYAWSIAPKTMLIFRNAVSGLISDSRAAITSTVLSCFIFLTIFTTSILKSSPDVLAPKLVVALIASCLLFAPYSGVYEDMLLISIFMAVLLTGRAPSPLSLKGLIIAGALFVCLLHNLPFLHNWLWLFFILKLLILVSMLHYAGQNDTHAPVQNF